MFASQKVEATGSIFGGSTPAPSLFGAPAEKKQESSLFGTKPTAPPTGGLFGAPTEKKESSIFGTKPAEGTSLFGQPQSTSNLFGALKPQTGLFSAGNSLFCAPSTSLFGQAQSDQPSVINPSSIFGQPTKQATEEDHDESDGGVQAEYEAPIYAEGGNEKVEFKKGVEIQKSPYTKVFDVSLF